MKTLSMLGGTIAALIATPALAWDVSFQARITMIEPTYLPDELPFSVDAGSTSCPAGTILKWSIRGDTEAKRIANTQAILASLLTAQSSRKVVDIYLNTSNCTVEFLHVL